MENGIPILPFYHNKEDRELKYLQIYLKNLKNYKDVRELNRNFFKFHLFNDSCGPLKIWEKLFGKRN